LEKVTEHNTKVDTILEELMKSNLKNEESINETKVYNSKVD
jgi:hypothetical protein